MPTPTLRDLDKDLRVNVAGLDIMKMLWDRGMSVKVRDALVGINKQLR